MVHGTECWCVGSVVAVAVLTATHSSRPGTRVSHLAMLRQSDGPWRRASARLHFACPESVLCCQGECHCDQSDLLASTCPAEVPQRPLSCRIRDRGSAAAGTLVVAVDFSSRPSRLGADRASKGGPRCWLEELPRENATRDRDGSLLFLHRGLVQTAR